MLSLSSRSGTAGTFRRPVAPTCNPQLCIPTTLYIELSVFVANTTHQNMYAVGTKTAYQDRTEETDYESSLEEGIGHGKDPCAQAALQQVDQCLGVPAGREGSRSLSAILSSHVQ